MDPGPAGRQDASTATDVPAAAQGTDAGRQASASESDAGIADSGAGDDSDDAGSADGCDYNGSHYAFGDSFPDDAHAGSFCLCGVDGVACGIAIDPAPQACGGFAALSCNDGEYCNFPQQAVCGAGDATGYCKVTPGNCRNVQQHPVCGCDGTNYLSACAAALAGVSVAADGQCATTDQYCTGKACGDSCDAPFGSALPTYCDPQGQCRPLPEPPVCPAAQ